MDRLDLLRGNADALDREAVERVGDRDDPIGEVREPALDEPEGADTERIVVVLRRDEARAAESGGEPAVDVGMDEMRVNDVRTQRACEPHEQDRIEVARRQNAHRRHVERTVEVGCIPAGIVEPDEDRLDTAFGERRQQRQQVPLRAADAANPVHVHDPHRVRTRRASH